MLRTYIAQGKRREAGFLLETRDKIHYFRHSEGNCMLRLLSLNIICKLALADAKITPAYIEKIYSTYIREIVTNLPISEVAEQVGINDYNYFSRVFKKLVGISPTRYRKTYNKEA